MSVNWLLVYKSRYPKTYRNEIQGDPPNMPPMHSLNV